MSEEILEQFKSYKFPILLCLVGLVLIIGGSYSSNLLSTPSASSAKKTSYANQVATTTQSSSQIKVDISGAINKPGVYSLSLDSRVEDAIKAAQGFSASASAEYIAKNLNLSQKVADGQKIYVPFQGEQLVGGGITGGGVVGGQQVAGVATTAKIGLNSATQAQLESLPGVGPATATKIIGARPYQSLEDLTYKKAVSKGVFEKIKDLVDLN